MPKTYSTPGESLKTRANSHRGADISDLVSEEGKLQPAYLKANADYCINTLVYDRKATRKARQLYNGERDEKEFAYLQKNFGIGNPAKLTFIPVIRKHIQVLLGQQATNPLNFKVTCSDVNTIITIKRLQKLGFVKNTMENTVEAMRLNMEHLKTSATMPNNPAAQLISEEAVRKLQVNYTEEWKSEFESIAQEVLHYHIYAQDLKLHFMKFLEDLLTLGEAGYRVHVEEIGTDPVFEVCNMENLFYRKNTDKQFIKHCNRIVCRKYMSRQEIINTYGHDLTTSELDWISGRQNGLGATSSQPINSGRTIEHEWEGTNMDGLSPDDTFEVYHCEWIANNRYAYDEDNKRVISPTEELLEIAKGTKISYRYRLDLYECTKIGSHIYTRMGKVKHVSRPVDRPWFCTLTYNGMVYSGHNGKPYSLVLATKSIQDKADILHMHLENIVARSGGKGIHVYAPAIPASFGDSIEERIMVHQAYVKAGLNLIDDIQDGAKRDFNNHGSYDLSLDGKSVEAVIQMLQFLEETASGITGVNRQTLGQIATEDGLGNTNIAMTQTALITKPYFVLVSELMKEALTDLVNASRAAYKNGKKGAYLLGDLQQKFFTVDGTKFQASDYGVFISDSGVEIKDLEAVKALTMKLVENQMVKADVAVDMVTIKSLAQGRNLLKKSLGEQEENAVQQLQQKLKEMEGQFQQMEAQLGKFNELDMLIKQGNLDLAVRKFEEEIALRKTEVSQNVKVSDKELDQTDEQMEIEREQMLFAGNEKSQEPKNNKSQKKK